MFLKSLLLSATVLLTTHLAATEIGFSQVNRQISPLERHLFEEQLRALYPDQKSDLESYATIVSVEVEELAEEDLDILNEKSEKSLGQVILVVDQLLALGKKIWPIIQAGKPVVTSNFAPTISVLPRVNGATSNEISFYEMENWSAPTQKSYKVSFKNGWGSEVISFVYTVAFQYNGSYQGKGRYITGLDVRASQISVSWGFEFNADSVLVNIANLGTQVSPVASATVRINYTAQSVLRTIQTSESFHVTGTGQSSKLY
jgi:hypothetical protein